MHELIRQIADNDRKYDPWGAGMTALGAVCDVLYAVGEGGMIPGEAGYRPAAGQCETPESFRYSEEFGEYFHQHALLAALVPDFDSDYWDADFNPDLTVADLVSSARVLCRYLDLCKLAGVDY